MECEYCDPSGYRGGQTWSPDTYLGHGFSDAVRDLAESVYGEITAVSTDSDLNALDVRLKSTYQDLVRSAAECFIGETNYVDGVETVYDESDVAATVEHELHHCWHTPVYACLEAHRDLIRTT